ncbi:lipopolysaccharide biosynthesis protein [Ferruginibacter albus]|uniref:lipopolysaccharide biosynthesis protein n=1 Tax=Ferruginibacter albus TaxID=2875540 RepID=UPI001CC5D123|nr:polysaccharide biosynthesis C-terminal domain-containing protein [Ferruginibacter albus]UAY53387.1 polysaccharide biosynthesis C-terminal domain-containing protein [Ferruginibacter albus]
MLSLLVKLIAQIAVIYIYSRQLSIIDYGNYQSVWLYTNVISVIGLFGLPSLLLSVPLQSIKHWIINNRNRFVAAIVLLNIIPFIYLLFLSNQFSHIERWLLIGLIIVQNFSIITETIVIKKEKEKLVLLTNIIFNIGYLGWHIFILQHTYSLQLLLIGLAVLFIVKTLILLAGYSRKKISIKDDKTIPVTSQWFFLGINDVLGIIFKWVDKWIILLLISVTRFALYFNGSYEIPVFALMLGAVGNIMLVEMAKTGTEDTKKIKALFNSSSLLLAAITFPSFCFLLFYHTEFFTFIFSNKYADAIPVFLVSIFIIPVRITNYTALLQSQHKNNIIVKGSILDLTVALVLMCVLYPLFKLPGLALAFVLSTYTQAFYYLWETAKILRQKITDFFPLLKLISIMVASVLITAIAYVLLKQLHVWWYAIGGVVVTIKLIILLLYYYIKKERQP